MKDKFISTVVEILGKPYPVRCPEEEVIPLQQAVDFLNQKIAEVQQTTKASLERLVITAALNISYQYHQKVSSVEKINNQISVLHDKLDSALNQTLQAELIYSDE